MTVEKIIDIAKNVGHVNAAKVLAEFIKEDFKDGAYFDTANLIKEFLKNGYKRFLPDILIYSMNYGIDSDALYKIFTKLEKKEIKWLKEVVEDETNNEIMCSIVEKLEKEIR